MRTIEVTETIAATARECFDFVAEPANIPRFMFGVKRYEPLGSRVRGPGARFGAVVTLAGRDLDAVLEITSWSEGERMVATSVSGPRTRGSWTFQEHDDGTTDVTLTQEYELPGIFRLLPQAPIDAGVRRELGRSLERLKELVEKERSPAPRRSRATRA